MKEEEEKIRKNYGKRMERVKGNKIWAHVRILQTFGL